MRLFIAVNAPDAVKEGVAALQGAIKKTVSGVKWVEKENLHLTLKFLGEIPGDRAAEISAALRKALRGTGVFRITLGGIGTFPSGYGPRAVWVGVKEGAGLLKNAAAAIDEALLGLGFRKEKRGFSPHMTLGRMKPRPADRNLPEKIAQYGSTVIGGFDCASVDLMESVLKPEGPEYRCVNSISIL